MLLNFKNKKTKNKIVIKQTRLDESTNFDLGPCRIRPSRKHSRRRSFFFHFIHIRFLLRTESSHHFLDMIHCQNNNPTPSNKKCRKKVLNLLKSYENYKPLTPVFHTEFVYLRPETMFPVTPKLNRSRYREPSLRAKRLLVLEVLENGNGSTRSARPGHWIVRLWIFTSASLLSAFTKHTSNSS